MSEANEPDAVGAIRDISTRFRQYGQLSASLVRDGWMSASGHSPLADALGAGAFGRLTRSVPVLRRLDRALASIGAIRAALNEMQAENAERHLQAAGLSREQVEADFQTISALTRRYTRDGAQNARKLAHEGIRRAGRATGKGLRAFRRWRDER